MMKALGIKGVNMRFERAGIAAVEAKPAMETIAEMMFAIFEQIFNSGGRRGGGSWHQDTDEWLTRKAREGLDPRVNHASLALRKAMTVRDADHQELVITHTTVDLRNDLPYSETANRFMPFVRFLPSDKLAMRNIIKDYLVEAFRA